MSTIHREPAGGEKTLQLGQAFPYEEPTDQGVLMATAWAAPVILQVTLPTGGTLRNATDPSRNTDGPVSLMTIALDDVITSSVTEPAIFKGTLDELTIVLQPGGQTRVTEDNDGASFLCVDVEVGRVTVATKQYLTGELSGSIFTSGPGRKFIVRSKTFAVGSNGTCYSVEALSSTTARVLGHEGTVTVCPEESSVDPYPERNVGVGESLIVETGRSVFSYPIVVI